MIPAIQPIKQQAYTNKGNEYTESNFGKYAAGASVLGGAAIYGGEAAFKNAKKIYGKAKTIKLDIPKIKKPDFKAIKMPKSFKELLANLPQKMNSALKTAKKAAVEGFKYAKTNIKKINLKNIKNLTNTAIDFVKTNAGKINTKNIKKTTNAVKEFIKKAPMQKAAGIAAAFAGIIAAGYAIDFVANKISAHKADKKA